MSEPMSELMSGLPADVLERVAETVRELVETPEVERFQLVTRPSGAAAPACDAFVDVFRSEEGAEVEAAAEFIDRRFGGHSKSESSALDVRDGAGHVCVALWARPDLPEP